MTMRPEKNDEILEQNDEIPKYSMTKEARNPNDET